MRLKLASAAIITISLFAGNALATGATYVPTHQNVNEPTSAEVAADLQAWKASGMAALWHTEATPDTYSQTYRERYATYLRMRGESSGRATPSGLGY